MDERKDDVLEMTNEEYRASSPDYGELIIEMVHRIDNQDYLEKIYYYVRAKYNREKERTGD